MSSPYEITSPASSSRPSARLDHDEAWSVVRRSHTAIFTTLTRAGYPIALPVWFVVDGETLLSRAAADSKRVARIRHEPRGSVLVESGLSWDELRAVHMVGDFEVDEGPTELAHLAGLLDDKYRGFVTPRAEMPDAAARQYEKPRVVVRFVPGGRILAWDNAKLRRDE